MSKLLRAVSSVLLLLSVSFAHAAEPALAVTFTDERLVWGACPDFIPNFTIPTHWHTSAERMVLVSGELSVTYEGQPTTVLKPGMYAYGPAKRAHKAVCASAAPCVLFIAFEAPVDAVDAETE